MHTFTVDLRSLALLRIGMAALILVDLADRAGFMRAHYTDASLYPRIDAARAQAEAQWSLHLTAGTSAQMGILFGVAALFAILLLLGWRTRWVTVISWLLLVSLQARTPPLSYGADSVLRVLMFYSMFLPIGARWSVDEMRAATEGNPLRADEHRSFASAALMLQVVFIYVFTGVLKLTDPSWLRLDAVFYALAGDHHATQIGLALSKFPLVTKSLSLLTLLLEVALPFLLFVPIGRSRVRVALVLVFCTFHVVTALTLHLGYFPWVSCLAWLALLPKEAWQRAGVATRTVTTHERRSVVPQILASVGVVLAFFASLDNTTDRFTRPAWMRSLAQAVSLEQRWTMFTSPMHDGWFIVAATPQSPTSPLLRASGDTGASADTDTPSAPSAREIDIMRGGAPVTYDRPAIIAHQFQSMRSRKLFTDMTFERRSSKRNRRLFLRYVCRSWNAAAEAGEHIARVDLIFMQVDDRPDGSEEPVRRRVLASRVCGPAAPPVNRDSDPYFERKPIAPAPDDDDDDDDGAVEKDERNERDEGDGSAPAPPRTGPGSASGAVDGGGP